jgi:hypothetical protein
MDATLFDLAFVPEVAEERAVALECLRDVVPEALEVVVHLHWWKPRNDGDTAHAGGDWAYTVCEKGLRFEPRAEWSRRGGWNVKPSGLVEWEVLADVLGSDPRRAEVVAWAESLTSPAWRDLYRPHELWPHPESWHPDYLAMDRDRPGYDERMRAWRTVLAILTEAAEAVRRG